MQTNKPTRHSKNSIIILAISGGMGIVLLAISFTLAPSKISVDMVVTANICALLAFLSTVTGLMIAATNHRVSSIRKMAAESQSRFNTLMSTSLDSIILINQTGQIEDLNQNAIHTFGHSKTAALGRNIVDLFFPEERIEPTLASVRQYLETGDDTHFRETQTQMIARHRDGRTFPTELSISSTAPFLRKESIVYIRDSSKQLAAETELMLARDKALESEETKTRFLAVMSHEMRTPLNGLLGTLELLEQTPLATKQYQYIDIAKKSGKLLLKHVNDVLDISRIEANQTIYESRPFNISKLLKEVCDMQQSTARAKGNTLSARSVGSIADTLIGNEDALRQILLNLVSNANKFTTSGSIVIEAESLGQGDDAIEFRVEDSGIGIAKESTKQIFEDFITLDPNFDREAEGTGLGLPIAKRLVEALHGEIGVESETGEGSLFWVRIPFASQISSTGASTVDETALILKEQPKERKSAPLKILLVEDNEINRFVAREMLELDGHEVTCAHDGEEGTAFARKNLYDIILMDISMPKLDGLAASKRIRSFAPPNCEVPIIALTAHAQPDDIREFNTAGMNSCLTKPVSHDKLRDILANTLNSADVSANITPPRVSTELPLIDRDVLLQLLQILGQTRVENLFGKFISEAETLVSELLEITEPRFVKDSLSTVHRLAGSASTFGAQRLHIILENLETSGKAGENQAFINDLASLKQMMEASINALRVELASISSLKY